MRNFRILLLGLLFAFGFSEARADVIMQLGTAAGTNSDVIFFNGTTGQITLTPVTGALGTVTASLPANTGPISETNYPETFTAVKTFTNSDFRMLGSSTGYTTFTSANAGATNYTITFPAVNDTPAMIGTADQTLSGGFNLTPYSIGVVASGTTTVDCGKNPAQWFVDGGASTLAAPTSDGQCTVKMINGNSHGTITLSGFREGSNTGDALPTTDRSTATVTFTNSSASIGWTNTLIANDPVYFTTTGGLPTNFTAGTVYYVSSTGLSGSNVEVSATPGGSVITAGSAGSGTQTGHAASSASITISRIDGMSHYLVTADQ